MGVLCDNCGGPCPTSDRNFTEGGGAICDTCLEKADSYLETEEWECSQCGEIGTGGHAAFLKHSCYSWVTGDMVQAKLEELVREMTPAVLLSYGDVSDILREELNNEILDALVQDRATKADAETASSEELEAAEAILAREESVDPEDQRFADGAPTDEELEREEADKARALEEPCPKGEPEATFSVWVEVERYNPGESERPEYENLDLPWTACASFDSEEKAVGFARDLHEKGEEWFRGNPDGE